MSAEPSAPTFTRLPDLASRDLAGSVVAANDELFAQRENLIKPGRSHFDPADFGDKGKVYDGWETRRRREDGHDYAIVRLGAPGIVHGVVVDTSWFTGNYPPYVSVEATGLEGYPSPEEVQAAEWTPLVPKSPVLGDTENYFEVTETHRFTHVRLSIYPDGGVARFRVHGQAMPDPRLMTGTVDVAELTLGASVAACSNMHYSPPTQILLPGRARMMGDGWENARRRTAGHEFVEVRLAGRAQIRRVEVDTSYFVGNAPGSVRLMGRDDPSHDPTKDSEHGWHGVLPEVRLQPDTRHFFNISDDGAFTHVRLDVIPDGGIARLRVHGEIVESDLIAHAGRWLDSLPTAHQREVLAGNDGATDVERLAHLLAR